MPIIDQFDSNECQELQQIAISKDYHKVTNIADAYWEDGSAGDCIWAIGNALEVGQKTPPEALIWRFYLEETAVYFIGNEKEIRAKLLAL